MAATQAPRRDHRKRLDPSAPDRPLPARVDADEALRNVSREIDKRQQALAESAASLIDPVKFKAVVLSTFTRTPGLWECDPISVARAVVEAAQAGLEPTGALGGAYLVPRWNNKTQRKEATLIIGYTGQVKLMRRSGEVTRVEARVVRAMDEFDFGYGLDPYLVHKPALDVPEDAHNPMTHVYGIIHYRSGERQFDVMTAAEVASIRERSTSKDRQGNLTGPWVTDPDEMAKKTVLRRMSKLAPLSVEAQRIMEGEEAIDLAREVAARTPSPLPRVTRPRIADRVMGGNDAAGSSPAPGAEPEHVASGRGTAAPANGEAADASPAASPPPDEPDTGPAPGEAQPAVPSGQAPSPVTDAPADGELCDSTSDPAMPPIETCSLLAGHKGVHRAADDRMTWPNRGAS